LKRFDIKVPESNLKINERDIAGAFPLSVWNGIVLLSVSVSAWVEALDVVEHNRK
jgi:hypothetical protein